MKIIETADGKYLILTKIFDISMIMTYRVMEIWTLNGDKAFLTRYIAEAQKDDLYLPAIQRMID